MAKRHVPAEQERHHTFGFLRSSVLPLLLLALLVAGPLACKSKEPPRNADAKPTEPPPQIPEHCVLRPEFLTQEGRLNAGTAFPLELEGQSRLVVLTAVHLFGSEGGLQKDIPASEIPAYVKSVTLYDAFTDTQLTTAGPMLSIPDAVPYNRTEGKDLAAFWAPKDGKLTPLRLAESRPEVGDTVWLAAPVMDGAPREQHLHRAVVRLSKAEDLEFEYDNAQLNLRATSGAPILNAEGKVVGVNVGMSTKRTKRFGMATPFEAIKSLLSKSLTP